MKYKDFVRLKARQVQAISRHSNTLWPTFRAENSNTPRHAAEFWMIEPEMAFTDLQGNMDLVEGLTCHGIDKVLPPAHNGGHRGRNAPLR